MTALMVVLAEADSVSWPEAVLGLASLGVTGFILWLVLR